MSGKYGFKAFTFDGKKTAGEALDTLEDFSPAYSWIDDVAEISVSKFGSIRIHSTWAQDDSEIGAGLGFGALTGGLIGMMLGPGGALAGAAVGASVGGLMGYGDVDAFDDPALDAFAASLAKDTSAVILVGEEVTMAEFVSAVGPFGGKIIETDLDEDDIKALHKSLNAAA